MTWFTQNIVGIAGILIGGFIAYHVYFLSQKLDLRDKLKHKDGIKKKVEPLLDRVRDSELVNVKKYFTHYPDTNEKDKHGYTYLKGELKSLRYDGVEFFCGVRGAYITPEGNLTLDQGNQLPRADFNLLEAGIIPYEWIEYVDARGDEFSYRPQFFVQFNGEDKSPYKYLLYYQESDTYHEESDPIDMKWRQVKVV